MSWVIFRGGSQFPKRPALPPGYSLPEGWQDWDGGEFPRAAVGTVIWSGAHELRKLQVVFGRIAPTGVQTDPAVITMHFLNLTNDAPDATWVDGDFTVVEGAFDACWASLKPWYASGIFLDQYRWYKDGPAYNPTPAEGNPAVRVVERSVNGTATVPPLPPQVAVSVTEKTALRKRWGRIYMPNPAQANTIAGGVIPADMAVSFADHFDTFYEACITGDIVPVVWSPTIESSYQIEHVQVDNLYDVIRSRRWKGPSQREVRSLTQ